jgi:hypothetical protein
VCFVFERCSHVFLRLESVEIYANTLLPATSFDMRELKVIIAPAKWGYVSHLCTYTFLSYCWSLNAHATRMQPACNPHATCMQPANRCKPIPPHVTHCIPPMHTTACARTAFSLGQPATVCSVLQSWSVAPLGQQLSTNQLVVNPNRCSGSHAYLLWPFR